MLRVGHSSVAIKLLFQKLELAMHLISPGLIEARN